MAVGGISVATGSCNSQSFNKSENDSGLANGAPDDVDLDEIELLLILDICLYCFSIGRIRFDVSK
jgi:hypothetical protein